MIMLSHGLGTNFWKFSADFSEFAFTCLSDSGTFSERSGQVPYIQPKIPSTLHWHSGILFAEIQCRTYEFYPTHEKMFPWFCHWACFPKEEVPDIQVSKLCYGEVKTISKLSESTFKLIMTRKLFSHKDSCWGCVRHC